MEFKYDVTAIGELLIDFTPYEITKNENPTFERNPGGAPANVLVALSNFNHNTAFIGKVGNDNFGVYLKGVLEKYNINTEGLILTEKYRTTLAFVHLDETGDRSFSFYRNPGADIMLDTFEVNKQIIKDSRILHFGSVSLTGSPSREAVIDAVKYAKSLNKIVSYDPNLRLALWESEEEARKYIMEGMFYADILKISKEELEFLVGTSELRKGAELLRKSFDMKIIIITLGAEGSYFLYEDQDGYVPAFTVNTVDTTGAGDAFTGGFLHKFIEKGLCLDNLTKDDLFECVRFGNASGSLSTTKMGAIPSIPKLDEVLEVL